MNCKTTFYLFMCLFINLISANVMAYGAKTDNWNVDGLNGVVGISVALTESPCSLAEESAVQEINMENISKWQLSEAGELSKKFPVHLILEHCMFDDSVRTPEHGNGLYWFPSQPVVMMSIIADEEPTNPHLYRVYGNTEGVALRLEDSDHNIIKPGDKSRPQILDAGRNDLIINAQLSRTIQALKFGDFQAVVNIGLEYH